MTKLEKIKYMVAEYMASEGCSCCESSSHESDGEVLCEALGMPKFDDGSGYDFWSVRDEAQRLRAEQGGD